MLPSIQSPDCDDCTPLYVKSNAFGTRAAISTLPFTATFVIITIIAYRKVYPLLSHSTSSSQASRNHGSIKLPLPAPATTSQTNSPTQTAARRVAALTFSSTIALSAVLTELLLCEISNSFNPTARSVALQITVASLLGLLVIAIPLLGISSVISQSGYKFRAEERRRRRLAWFLEFIGYAIFLVGFWFIGALLPGDPAHVSGERDSVQSVRDSIQNGRDSLFQACLDRLGITGVSLMALLSGFASVSAVWTTFGPQPRLVHDNDITRKQAGLDATNDLISEKKSRLRRLGEKTPEPSARSFWARNVVGTFRGAGVDEKEKQMLDMEINGLETMASSLDTSLSVLRSRRSDQKRQTTRRGRLMIGFNYGFACYCVYRIVTTGIAISRRTVLPFLVSQPRSRTASSLARSTALRYSSPSTDTIKDVSDNSADTDPVTTLLALVATYIYPDLNTETWTQQISFLLSGIILLASFSAVTQTFHLFSRFFHLSSLLHATRTNFALLISQISGMYVISSALMLRGMMPKEVGGVIDEALGAGMLKPGWIRRWFEGWFFVAVCFTTFGIWFSRVFGGVSWDDSEDGVAGGLVENELGMEKRS